MTDEIRRIDNPPEIMWAGNRSLLLTLRHARRVLRVNPEPAADVVVKAASGNGTGLGKLVNALAECIDGALDADADADEREPVKDGE